MGGHSMPTYSLAEIEKILDVYDFNFESPGKGDHFKYVHKYFPFLKMDLYAKSKNISANVAMSALGMVALLSVVTEHSTAELRKKKLYKAADSIDRMVANKSYRRCMNLFTENVKVTGIDFSTSDSAEKSVKYMYDKYGQLNPNGASKRGGQAGGDE